uniref:Testican-2-like n=1 Tax=Sinocyclocheilus rhinocerous TaxID=307959 RepID=A0A673G1G1_9TELE
MNDLGCLLVPLLMLVRVSVQVDVKSGKEPEKTENFMEDEQWLSTISQYSRKIKHWNRFRDDDYIRSWDESQGSNESKSSLILLTQVIRQQQENNCKPCPVSSSGPVCGSDGHNYASQCKLEQQACLTGKELKVRCAGLCPCTATVAPATDVDSKQESCTGQDLADLGDRLRDWFQLLQGNGKQNSTGNPVASSASIVDRTLVATCKDSIGWMFSKLDTNSDLYLDQAELSAINLDKYEVCIRPFFNSCDSYHDGKVSTAEWCLCFWREKPPCLAELERIQVQEGAKKKSDTYIPSCDEDGFYRRLQCDKSRGECWCVDQHGGELMGSRIHGNPDCDEVVTYSGDFGSGLGWEDEEEKEAEENGEEAEEEEGEVGEVDDGGYIW